MSRICFECGRSNTYVDKEGYAQWYVLNDKFVCSKCRYRLLVQNRRIQFGDKRLTLNEDIRNNICQICGLIDCKTDMHHYEYDDENPLNGTIEICVACHMKETMKAYNVNNLRAIQ